MSKIANIIDQRRKNRTRDYLAHIKKTKTKEFYDWVVVNVDEEK